MNPFIVGSLADLPFDGQSAILQRGRLSGAGCHYVGNGSFVPGDDLAAYRGYAAHRPAIMQPLRCRSAGKGRSAITAVCT